MKKIVFLVSGNGGNMKFIYYLLKEYNLPINISNVIGDRNCEAINFAKQNNIDHKTINFKDNDLVLNSLLSANPDYIITNVHKILSENIVNSFKEKLINLHYSLLPSYKGLIGMKPVDNAIKDRVKFIGTTTHKVITEIDSGSILCQTTLTITENINKELIYNIIFRSGALNLWNVIAYNENFIFKEVNKLNILSNEININPKLKYLDIFTNESFWKKLK